MTSAAFKEDLSSPAVSDIIYASIFPIQLEKKKQLSPTKLLLLAIVAQAYDDLRTEAHGQDAAAWFLDVSERAFGFRWVASSLGWNPTYFVEQLKERLDNIFRTKKRIYYRSQFVRAENKMRLHRKTCTRVTIRG
jgi:hypothetical protein